MSPEGIAALLVAITTFLGGLIAAYRSLSGDKFDRKVKESTALLTGYTEMVSNLRREIDAMRTAYAEDTAHRQRQHQNEIQGLAILHKEERDRWSQERERLEDRIEVLEAQVAAVIFRPEGAKTRNDDP